MPSFIWAADPCTVALTTAVSPDEAVDVNVSPSVNLFETLSVPEFLYFTNIVLFFNFVYHVPI